MIDVVPHLPRLRRYALSLTRDATAADDLVQDTVVRALDKQTTFTPGSDFRAWLFTVMHSVYVNGVRAAARRPAVDRDDLFWSSLPAVSDTEAATYLREVGEAVSRLPREQQRVLVGAALLQRGRDADSVYAALAAYEGVPVGTVRSRLSRARAALHGLTHGTTLTEEELALL